jgi:hypothetical protein
MLCREMRTTVGEYAPYMKTCILTVTGYDSGEVLSGECAELSGGKTFRFSGCLGMIESMEKLLDQPDPPFPKEPVLPVNLPGAKREALASFRITVYFRQHSSWQGTALWIDHQETFTFRSALDLLFFLNRALQSQKTTRKTPAVLRTANSGKKGTNCFE